MVNFQNKLLFQESETNNIIFPMYDENKEIVGAELCGTLSDKRFKGIKAGSKYGYGFNINPTQSEIIKIILFFESAIDLLSFFDMKKLENKGLKNCLLVSLAGLKDNIIKHYLDSFNNAVELYLCVDNDTAGINFVNEIKTQINDVKTLLPNCKDWNDQLKLVRKLEI